MLYYIKVGSILFLGAKCNFFACLKSIPFGELNSTLRADLSVNTDIFCDARICIINSLAVCTLLPYSGKLTLVCRIA